MEERVERALESRKRGYTCSQAVLCAYSDLLDVKEELLFAAAEGFGGGMGGLMGTCGAVNAMSMAAGLKNSCKDLSACSTKPDTIRRVRALAEEFADRNQSIICRELKGVDSGKPLKSCEECIASAVEILAEQLFGEEVCI